MNSSRLRETSTLRARHAREIAARARQAVHDAERNGIASHLEHDRDGLGGRFRREPDRSAAGRDNDRDFPARRDPPQRRAIDRIGPPPSGTRSRRCGPRHIRLSASPSRKALRRAGKEPGRFWRKISDDRHGGRLRARRKRPRRRSAEPGEDIAPPHPTAMGAKTQDELIARGAHGSDRHRRRHLVGFSSEETDQSHHRRRTCVTEPLSMPARTAERRIALRLD